MKTATKPETERLAEAVILLARKGQRLPDGPARHCGNCVHNARNGYCMQYGRDVLSARRYAVYPGSRCDVQFSGWTAKPRAWWEFWK